MHTYDEEYILILLLNQFVQLNRYLMESVEMILHIIDRYVVYFSFSFHWKVIANIRMHTD